MTWKLSLVYFPLLLFLLCVSLPGISKCNYPNFPNLPRPFCIRALHRLSLSLGSVFVDGRSLGVAVMMQSEPVLVRAMMLLGRCNLAPKVAPSLLLCLQRRQKLWNKERRFNVWAMGFFHRSRDLGKRCHNTDVRVWAMVSWRHYPDVLLCSLLKPSLNVWVLLAFSTISSSHSLAAHLLFL